MEGITQWRTWADLVLVMEQKHRSRLLADFPDRTKFLTIHVLDIPDDYGYMDAELVQLLRIAVEHLIEEYRLKSQSKP
jgi:predicted protein tyrosine phosphatase